MLSRAKPERAFEGRFLQMRNSQVTSRFAELRSYLVSGEKVSTARHYGFDLASTARAPINASNNGTVLFADGRIVTMKMGEDFPMTEKFIAALREIASIDRPLSTR